MLIWGALQDYVELGLTCADVCTALDRGLNGKRLDELSNSVCEAINQLTTWATYRRCAQFKHSIDDAVDRRTVAEIQRKIVKRGGRNAVSRPLHAKGDKEAIATWRSDLNRILLIFDVRFVLSVLATTNLPSPDRTCDKHTRSCL